jgi:hypothetical protein
VRHIAHHVGDLVRDLGSKTQPSRSVREIAMLLLGPRFPCCCEARQLRLESLTVAGRPNVTHLVKEPLAESSRIALEMYGKGNGARLGPAFSFLAAHGELTEPYSIGRETAPGKFTVEPSVEGRNVHGGPECSALPA